MLLVQYSNGDMNNGPFKYLTHVGDMNTVGAWNGSPPLGFPMVFHFV